MLSIQTIRTATPGYLRIRSAGDPRSLLVTDLLRRTAELHGLRVQLAYVGDAAALNVRPADAPDLVADVEIGAQVTPADVPPGSLSVRLALMQARYNDPVDLSPAAIAAAEELLQHWRSSVARWAEQPSEPIVPSARASLLNAFADDLDSPTALRMLQVVETSPDIPDGARFETFAWADRLMGLDLAADVGRPMTG